MPRLPRIYCPDAVYYVILSGDPRGFLFKDDDDRKQYLELIKKYKEQYEFKLFSYLFLPNKIYLIIEPSPEVNISQIMHSINSLYSKYFNSRYQRSGHLFRERFKDILVEKEAYLTELTRHAHLNPVYLKFSLTPEAYHWSSYHFYSDSENKEEHQDQLIDTKDVLSRFSGSIQEQKKAYCDFVTQGKKEELESFKKKVSRAWIVGSKNFVRKARNIAIKKKAEAEKQEEITDIKVEALSFSTNLLSLVKSRQFAAISLVVIMAAGFLIVKGKQKISEIVRKEVSIGYAEKEKEAFMRMQEAKEALRRDYNEKYKADVLSSKVMMRRLEMEEKKNNDRVTEQGI